MHSGNFYDCSDERSILDNVGGIGSTAHTNESGKTIRPRIQQTGANLSKISWQLISETAAFKLSIGSCLLNSRPDHFAAFNCVCSALSLSSFNFCCLMSQLISVCWHRSSARQLRHAQLTPHQIRDEYLWEFKWSRASAVLHWLSLVNAQCQCKPGAGAIQNSKHHYWKLKNINLVDWS